MGIGPLLLAPPERKNRQPAFSQLSIDASMWRPADWARRKGLYAELHSDTEGMDDSIVKTIPTSLSNTNPDAMREKSFMAWHRTLDELLKERAAISGRLVLKQLYKGIYRQV